MSHLTIFPKLTFPLPLPHAPSHCCSCFWEKLFFLVVVFLQFLIRRNHLPDELCLKQLIKNTVILAKDGHTCVKESNMTKHTYLFGLLTQISKWFSEMQVIFVCSPRNQLKLKQVTNNVNTGLFLLKFLLVTRRVVHFIQLRYVDYKLNLITKVPVASQLRVSSWQWGIWILLTVLS